MAGLKISRPVAEFSMLVATGAEAAASIAAELPVSVVAVPVLVPVPLARSLNERDDDNGLGHAFLYTYCSASPLQVVVSSALYVPFG
jgi:hypothetical protein